MDLFAEIKGVEYTSHLCAKLKTFPIDDLKQVLSKNAAFILEVNKKSKVAVSRWVSAKRTRSYPYARVYDTHYFDGKRITVIPVVKDEGKSGDRDFLQWDTVSLMSLLGFYTIIGYYTNAERSTRDPRKINNQRFDAQYVGQKIRAILSYQSNTLHWNLSQTEEIGAIAEKAIENYERISRLTKVEMHSKSTARRKIGQLLLGRKEFMRTSRQLARSAQLREAGALQPKEKLSGVKGCVTIRNYLGGLYYFTADEVEIKGDEISLIESKHSRGSLPSAADIKDGLIKMMLFTNLKELRCEGRSYAARAVLKLTTENGFRHENLNATQKKELDLLRKEAKSNGFTLRLL